MAKNEVVTALKQNRRSFTVIGKVKLPHEGFEDPQENESGTWLGVRTGFSVETEEGNSVFVTLNGGRTLKTGTIMVFSKKVGEKPIYVPFADREKEDILKNVSDMSFYKIRLSKDQAYKTIDYLDYVEYIKDNLEDGMEVVVKGNVEYSEYEKDGETRVYRNYNVNNIYVNNANSENANGLQYDRKAEIYQTYIFTDNSLSSSFAKELKEEGKTVVSAFVPQYVSKKQNAKGDYVKYQRTIPILQSFVLKVDKDDEEKLAKLIKQATILFKLKRDQVVERDILVKINEGYKQVEGKLEISKEMQSLIDEGILSEEDFQEAPTISSTRVSELEYKSVVLIKNEETQKQELGRNRYTMESLVRPLAEDEAEEQFDILEEPESKKDVFDIFGDDLFDDIQSDYPEESDLPF